MDPSGRKVKTRLLIVSDTHGATPRAPPERFSVTFSETPFRKPFKPVDVVLHCGDLTKSSEVDEFRATLKFLREIDAPLKLVIGGNHDGLLDPNYTDTCLQDWKTRLNFTAPGRAALERQAAEVRALVDDARADGVVYLEEGTHEFVLRNGALLRIFASPATPSYGSYAFQFDGTHTFRPSGPVDVFMTHGPARGVLDRTKSNLHGGCDDLLRAVYAARPLLHCHGHIHEGWGAELVTWLDGAGGDGGEELSRATAVDEERSRVLDDLSTAGADDRWGSEEENEARRARRRRLIKTGFAEAKAGAGQPAAVVEGEQTLVVNASIMDKGYRASNLPWVVELDLPEANLVLKEVGLLSIKQMG